ncbi:MAG: N-acetylmuramoyl-L-alanine amidase [Ferruginibacter sp.]
MYKKRVKAFSKQLRAHPSDIVTADSLKTAKWVGATNFNLRKPNFVIIHHTAQNSCDKTLKTFTRDSSQVSAHYVICKDGTLHHMLNDHLRAWHAGVGKWGNNSDINSSSVGIEIDNNGTEAFTPAQLNVLEGLLAKLKKEHNIPVANFIGHSDIAPARKVDPNVNFPWKYFAEKGYGTWYDDTTGIELPQHFNDTAALRIIGYDVKNINAATQAFRRHFLTSDVKGRLTDPERKVLLLLMRKFM